jgi:hypothetical protein
VPSGAVTTFSTASRARLRHANAGQWPGACRTRSHRAGMRDRDGHRRQDHSGETLGHRPTSGRRQSAPSRAEALTGAPPPPGQQARSRWSAVPRRHVVLMTRLQRPGLARPPCRASSRRARSQSRALPAVASPRRWAQAPTLECDRARQGLGTYRKDGRNQDGTCMTPCAVARTVVDRYHGGHGERSDQGRSC